jgi:hypothetical protein
MSPGRIGAWPAPAPMLASRLMAMIARPVHINAGSACRLHPALRVMEHYPVVADAA